MSSVGFPSLSQIHTMISYLYMIIFPEYAKKRTDAKAIERGGLYKEAQAETIVNQVLSKRNIWNSS
jgi:hypothetical protein